MAKTYSVTITEFALRDIASISFYIFEQSNDPAIADSWETSLHKTIRTLEHFPNRFGCLPGRPYRKMSHGRYFVVYRVFESKLKVRICRVVHSARLLKNVGPLE